MRLPSANKMGVHLKRRGPQTANWPVWLLCAAWFCANSPQAVTYDLIGWVHGAKHFSHQERLRSDVAFILNGKKSAPPAVAVGSRPARPHVPSVPAEALLKKLDLYAPAAVAAAEPRAARKNFQEWPEIAADRAQPEPLLPPPRGDGIS